MRTDEQLMACYLEGGASAFDELYTRHVVRVRRLIKRRVFREAEVEDLVQQTFMQLHAARASYRTGELVRPWLSTIALNVCRDHLRRLQRRPEASAEMDDLAAPPPRTIEDAGTEAAVLRALEALSDVTQQIFREHFLEQRSLVEIAAAMGANPNTVRVRLHRGCRELRTTLRGAEQQSG